jgi:predicted RNA-binding Zn-ribbon protein involved in translation (DUF1610 family)
MKNVEILQTGVQCDACDWKDENDNDYEKWLNQPCPKCGANIMTEEDLKSAKLLMDSLNFINSLTEEQLALMNETLSIENLKESDLLKNATGLESLDGEGLYQFTVDSHKGINVTDIKKVDD